MKKLRLEAVIPSYNGLPLLKKHLPDLIADTLGLTRVIVVDNGSTDGTAEYLAKNYPDKVRCLRNEKNLFFPAAVNQGFREVKADLVLLMNNDVHTSKNYLPAAINHFIDNRLFAVTLNETQSSWPLVSWQGKLQYRRGEDKTKARYSAWASGGSAIFRKEIWDNLGGFDEVYTPGYWEDIDIGWRAWKAGYTIIWEPKAVVEHHHESTFSQLDQGYVSLIKQRNELLFNWKNITDPDLRRGHLFYLLRHAVSHPGYLKVILAALAKWSEVRTASGVVSDREILSRVNQPLP